MEWTTRTTILNELRKKQPSEIWKVFVETFMPILASRAAEKGLQPIEAEEVAEDILTEFFKALRAGRYKKERGRLHDWLFGIAHYKIRSFVRARHRELRIWGDCTEGFDIANLPDEKAVKETWDSESRRIVLSACLRYAFKKSSRRTFDAFVLYFLKELPTAEVAEKLGMSGDAVHLAKHRVLARMREYAEKFYRTV